MGSVIRSFLFCGVLRLVFLVVRRLVGKAAVQDREKASPYECGFEPIAPTRVSFSLRFFLIAVIFLIFDLEIVLIFPFIIGLVGNFDWVLNVRMACFLVILRVGLVHEWNEGSLDWQD